MAHKRTPKTELGYTREVCAECGADWPCPTAVKERCARLLPEVGECTCGWHDPTYPRAPDLDQYGKPTMVPPAEERPFNANDRIKRRCDGD